MQDWIFTTFISLDTRGLTAIFVEGKTVRLVFDGDPERRDCVVEFDDIGDATVAQNQITEALLGMLRAQEETT